MVFSKNFKKTASETLLILLVLSFTHNCYADSLSNDISDISLEYVDSTESLKTEAWDKIIKYIHEYLNDYKDGIKTKKIG